MNQLEEQQEPSFKKKRRRKNVKNHVLGVVAHSFSSCTSETEAGGISRFESAWSTLRVSEQPGLHRETLSPEKKKRDRERK